MSKALNIPVEEFIKPFFDASETVCVRVFADRKGSPFKAVKLEYPAGKITTAIESLKKHNEQNRGIFFVINYGGHEDLEITRINAQFVENDSLSIDEQLAKIEEFPLPPSMIVRTKKSLHTYWLMRDAKVEDFRKVQKKLIAQFDGDSKCINESRVLRLPGFNHCKGEPVMVSVIKFNPELRYTQAELEAVLPVVEDDEPVSSTKTPKGSRKGLSLVGRRCDFIQHCKKNVATLSEHDWYSMITNLAVFDGGDKVIHTLSKAYPNYSYKETQVKINHFIESGTKPITCSTIADKGFKCPKLETDECGCKAPAALCYKALGIDDLRSFLKEIVPIKSAVEDITLAQNFVTEYLYNIDSVIAGTFIEFELKDYFGLKTASMKPLVSLQKELYKAYRENKDTKRETMGDELPDWYEPTERGGLRFLPGILAKHVATNVDVFYAAEQHFIYQGGVYRDIREIEAQRMVQEKMLPRETKMSQIVDTEHQWRLLIQRDIRELNANPYIINVKNGLYNVFEDTLVEHTPKYYSTVQLNVAYDKTSDCPLFKKFLKETMGGDMEQVALIQEMLGYFLIPVNSAQKCFVIVGAAGAGKSVLLRVLNDILLGKQNVSNVSWQALNERFKTAELFGKLANIFADLPTKNIDDNGIFKALVGEDYLTVEKKNKNPFSFQSCARLLFSCNSIPKNYGDRSEGFYRRLIIMRFNHTVPKDKRDPNLVDKFRAEADGIFVFALEGLKRLMKNHYAFSETEKNKTELQQYREDSDSVLSFVREYCQVDAMNEVGSTELFNAYKGYCEECGLKPYSQKMFIGQLTSSLPEIVRNRDKLGKRRILSGIKLGEMLD